MSSLCCMSSAICMSSPSCTSSPSCMSSPRCTVYESSVCTIVIEYSCDSKVITDFHCNFYNMFCSLCTMQANESTKSLGTLHFSHRYVEADEKLEVDVLAAEGLKSGQCMGFGSHLNIVHQ